jgi:hypothetical protein
MVRGELGITVPDDDTEVFQQLLHTLMKSQSQKSDADTCRSQIRRLEPEIPEENIWGKPLALVRRQNITDRFWASTFEKLLPPVPEAEWNRLRDLATGVIPFEGAPPRRSRPRPQPAPKTFLTASSLKLPIQDACRHLLTPLHHITKEHHITARFMRRIWGDIWCNTPKVSYDKERKSKWVVTWGSGRSTTSKGIFGVPGRQDLELFEGIDTPSK